MGLIVLVVGVIGIGAVIGAVVVFAVLRSRRNSGPGTNSPSAGNYSEHMGYSPQQPIYPPHPAAAPNRGNPPYPGQYSNPYGQQPPNQGK